MAASPPSTLQLGRPPRGAGGPSWSQAGKLVSTFRRGLSLEKPFIMSEAEGTRESFLLLLSSSMVPGWLEVGT